MTKRDTIVLAVLFNIVVLACVLATAQQAPLPTKREQSPKQQSQPIPVSKEEVVEPCHHPKPASVPTSFDEIDQLLEEYVCCEHKKNTTVEEPDSSDCYVVCPGDNPWNIAKKFNISFEKLLKLNQLDEVKARNLKIGQTLRIRESS